MKKKKKLKPIEIIIYCNFSDKYSRQLFQFTYPGILHFLVWY